MILNAWTVSSLFLDAVGAVLASLAVTVSLRSWARLGHLEQGPARERAEEVGHLLALLLGALALGRLLAWPQLYVLLESWVPDLAVYGVMCPYGVAAIRPGLVSTLETLKPVVLLALGFWWVLARVDRNTSTAPCLAQRVVLAVPLALLALVECLVEVGYILVEKTGRPVTCCTQFLETGGGQSEPGLIAGGLGLDDPSVGLTAYAVLHALVIAAALWARRTRGREAPSARFGPPVLSILMGAANLVITYWVWQDVVSPRVLGLPYHHCVYELFTRTIALGPAAVFCVLGTGALAWPLLLEPLRRRAREAVISVQRGIYGLCAVLIASEALIVFAHCV